MAKSLTELFINSKKRLYPHGQIILFRGDSVNYIGAISKGYIKVYDVDSKGNDKILLILGPGDSYPISIPGNDEKAKFFYKSITDVELLNVSYNDFAEATKEGGYEFGTEIVKSQNRLINILISRTETVNASTAIEKLVRVMQYLIFHHGSTMNGEYAELNVPMSHQLLSEMAGLARETTSIKIKELEKNKVVKTGLKGKIYFSEKRAETLGLA